MSTTVSMSVCSFANLSTRSSSARYSSTPTFSATARAVRSLSPVIITTRDMPYSWSFSITSAASSRSGSSMQMTAATSPPIAR